VLPSLRELEQSVERQLAYTPLRPRPSSWGGNTPATLRPETEFHSEREGAAGATRTATGQRHLAEALSNSKPNTSRRILPPSGNKSEKRKPKAARTMDARKDDDRGAQTRVYS
jgi:hypothetical protein